MSARIVSRIAIAAALVAFLAAHRAAAHCDGLDGPVVKAAQKALETGDVNLTLIWVRPADEREIAAAFERTRAVRTLSPQARELADNWFFETLVRIHRAGEGAPYTGLKPAGRDLGPAIQAADQAAAAGQIDPVQNLLTADVQTGLKKRFGELVARRDFKPADLEAGRQFVRAYVEFVHYVDGIHQAARGAAHAAPCDHAAAAAHSTAQAADHAAGEAACPHTGAAAAVAKLPAPPAAPAHDAAERPVAAQAAVAIPKPLKLEHDALHERLVDAIGAGGRTGEAARAVAAVLHPHFVKEERFALPPLGLLPAVARGQATADMRPALTLTGTLKTELPQMVAEHRQIVAALDELKAAAVAENKPEIARFAEALGLHARTEEEVLYPAAIVLGEYLQAKLPQ